MNLTAHTWLMLTSACSKLANVMFAYELQRREPDLVVPIVHPGVINTALDGSQG